MATYQLTADSKLIIDDNDLVYFIQSSDGYNGSLDILLADFIFKLIINNLDVNSSLFGNCEINKDNFKLLCEQAWALESSDDRYDQKIFKVFSI